MNLWHADDFNGYWNVSPFNTIFRKRTSPFVISKDFDSPKLGSIVRNMRVTASAMYAMDDKGGFDEYIMRTSPEEMRSNAGERLRNLMYYYVENPKIKKWGLPWKTLFRKRDLADPWYARYRYALKRKASVLRLQKSHQRFTPYFLPQSGDNLYVQRDVFVGGSSGPKLNLWWKENPRIEVAFRRRLETAKSFDEAHPDHREIGSYRKGEGAGGGGWSGSNVRPRSKTYRSRSTRSY